MFLGETMLPLRKKDLKIEFLLHEIQKVEEVNSGNSKGKYVTTTIAMKRKKNSLNCVSNGAYLVLEWCFPKSSLPLNFRTNNFIAFRSTVLTRANH